MQMLAFKNKKSTNNSLKIKNDNGPVIVFICFHFHLHQKEFDTYRTTFYPICISGRYFLFQMTTKILSDTYFGSIQSRLDMLKKQLKTCQKCQQC